MAARQPTLPGANDLFSLLRVIQDPKIVKKFFDEYHSASKGLDKQLKEIEAAGDRFGKLKAANQMIATAEEQRLEGVQALKSAKEKASESTARAKAKADKVEEETKAWADEMQATMKEKADALSVKEKALDSLVKNLEKRENAVAIGMAEAKSLKAVGVALQKRYEQRVALLEGAMREAS
jgi:uncharacterized phage infection (PIP) family protein YhgE